MGPVFVIPTYRLHNSYKTRYFTRGKYAVLYRNPKAVIFFIEKQEIYAIIKLVKMRGFPVKIRKD